MKFTECKAIFPALIQARAGIKEIVKDTKGNFGKYATLAGINDAIMPALSANGLTVVQEASTARQESVLVVTVETWLVHSSGEYLQFTPLSLPVGDGRGQTAQAVGSAISYGRRYALMAALNLSADDDDGQAATDSRAAAKSAPAEVDFGMGKPTPEAETGELADDFALVNMHELGTTLYGKDWDRVRHANIKRLTNGRTDSSKQITQAECDRLRDAMAKMLQEKDKVTT